MSSAIQKNNLFGRRVFSRRAAKRCKKGRCYPTVFLIEENKNKISVDKFNVISEKSMTNIGDESGINRKQSFYGWATLQESDILKDERKIELTPKIDNPCHAEIIIPLVDEKKEKVQRTLHASHLASFAKWKGKATE